MKLSDYAKQDEMKANEIAERINKKNEDQLAGRKQEHHNRLMAASMSNFQRIKQDNSHVAQLKSREQVHPGKTAEVYATLRLREIAEGLSPEDIKRKG